MVRLYSAKCDLCAAFLLNKYQRLLLQKATYSTRVQSSDFAPGYVPSAVEKDKYKIWENNTLDSNEESGYFSMIMPPPNITGTLHLGHALTLTIQDVLMRWNRMNGISPMWVPGLDHAGIATQVVVERKLWQEKHQTRHHIGRDAFEKEVHLWKHEKSSQIREQIKKLGALPNWDKEYFTMDKQQAHAVNEAFIRLFEAGLIYRSDYLVNWSCILRSAISDIEVEHLNVEGRTKLNIPGYEAPIEFGVLTKFAYKLADGEDEIVVSTTRPETILGDVAIAVHPEDPRYFSYKNKFVKHPFRNETMPIIFDEFVDPNFGTGAVKVTPAHDQTDFTVGQKHHLPIRQIIDEQGNIIDESHKDLNGLKRFDARNVILTKLGERGLLRSMEDHSMSIPLCSRSRDVVEHLVKPQWFLNCSDIAAKAAQDVREGRLTIEPALFEKTWFNWLENIRDWCISRQLWWGHRIPAFSCTSPHLSSKEGHTWVAASNASSAKMKAAHKFNLKNPKEIDEIKVVQDEDVLDTWFSSALLPFSVFGWPQKTSKFYPTDLLETGHDILFFWVARMVMLGHALTAQIPFKKILLHGVICDSHGRKMSKSLGNVIAPEQIINGATLQELKEQTQASHNAGFLSAAELDKALAGQQKMFPEGIPQCGADALRFTLLSHNIQSHFINFDINECYTNKLFCNKIWQSVKYTKLAFDRLHKRDKVKVAHLTLMDRWILSRLSCMVQEVNSSLERHQFHNATNVLKQFLYSEFCDVYVETTKATFKRLNASSSCNSDDVERIAEGHVQVLVECLDVALRTLAPFMPHLSDELYKYLPSSCSTNTQIYQSVNANASFAAFPKNLNLNDAKLEEDVQIALDTVTVIRRLKKLANLKGKSFPKVYIVTSATSIYPQFTDVIANLSACSDIIPTLNVPKNIKTISDTVGSHGVVHILQEHIDCIADKHLEKKIEKLMKEINKLYRTISAEGYQTKAPENVQIQHNKKAWPFLTLAACATILVLLKIVQGSQEQHHRRERYTDVFLNSDEDTGGGGSSSIETDTSECIYPCSCPSSEPPDCLPGVVAERDGCGCCLVCPRQLGEPCGVSAPCDTHRGLVCRKPHQTKPKTLDGPIENGICRESNGLPCVVYNRTYEHGETFSLDCRTQCACQNGTYGCSSLCPQEHISPKGSCSHPRLVDVPGQCCREWMCDSQAAQQPPECQPTFTRWSHCSHTCGAGVSRRRSNLNAACEATTETRLCQVRRCDGLERNPFLHDRHHHVRKGHECKATHRLSQPVRLRFGPCYSRKLFRPKYCGSCSAPGIHCEPLLSTTVKVDFLCAPPPPEIASAERNHAAESGTDLALEYMEPGEDMWRENTDEMWRNEASIGANWEDFSANDPITQNGWQDDGLALTVSVQWILKCRCSEITKPEANGGGVTVQAPPTAASGEIILHRVHRTAAP